MWIGGTFHFKGSAVCRGKKLADAKKTKNEVKASQVEELSQVGHTNGIGRVAEIVRAAGDGSCNDGTKSRQADLRMTVLDHGQAAQPLTVGMLIDSGFKGKCCQRRIGNGCKLVGTVRSPS